jgi:5-methylcytosine-specific restriction protein A
MSKDKFYSTKAWEAMRMRVIRESRHKCQNCARYGKMQDATTVHHANPIEERPDLRLKRWNLIALCDECHNKMHDRSTHKLTALGERWRMRVSPPPNAKIRT